MTRKLTYLTIFLGSFLLFGVQPMVGSTLLPVFGGTASVWTVCLAAFQTLLLAGYFYAHLIHRRTLCAQRSAHTLLLALAVVWTAAFAFYRPMIREQIGNSGMPALEVLFCVLVIAGLPYVLLSAGSTLVQAWLAKSSESRGVYRLYAVSNLGSFCGLLAYPLLFEPHVSLTAQWWGFAAGLAVYAALLWRTGGAVPGCPGGTGVPARNGRLAEASPQPAASADPAVPAPSDSPAHAWLWFVLPATSVFMLNAVTAHLTMDVMPFPLLWVILLGLFLLSYVIGFTAFAEKSLPGWALAACLFTALAAWGAEKSGSLAEFAVQFIGAGGLCLTGGVFLHGALYRLRPETRHLTQYYLFNALGGAVGGLLASLVAPLVFNRIAEYPVTLVALTLAVAVYAGTRWVCGNKRAALLCFGGVFLAGAMLIYQAFSLEDTKGRKIIHRTRGFYGVVTVTEMPASAGQGSGVVREFIHGSTVHGIQARIPGKERMTTTYFTETGGGFALHNHPHWKTGRPMRVGLVGMGIGVLAGWCRPNDHYRCYEISPEVIRIATDPQFFTFLSGAPGKVEVIAGDARKKLQAEVAHGEPLFDVLVIDAFTGDNIPYHLSTREAFALYFERLKPDGILAVNISNWHMDLMPFAKAVSIDFDCSVIALSADKDLNKLAFGSVYAIYCRQPGELAIPPKVKIVDFTSIPDHRMPTDEKGSFVKYLSW